MSDHLIQIPNWQQTLANTLVADLFNSVYIVKTKIAKSEHATVVSNHQSYRFLSLMLLGFVILVLTGCAGSREPLTVDQNPAEITNNHDPLEKINRPIYAFNLKADKYVLRPLAKTYRKVTPDPVEKGINNFFENLGEPSTVVNSALQGKLGKAGTSAGRFVLNSTVGVLGIFDVAGKLDIPENEEDFGQTLAVWGMPSGPYLVLPFLGPSNVRDTIGDFVGDSLITNQLFNPDDYISDSNERLALQVVEILDARAEALGFEDILEIQLDPYVFHREFYRQRRQQEIEDSEEDDDDEFDDDFDDDDDDKIF